MRTACVILIALALSGPALGSDADRMVFLLQYVGSDYAGAVRGHLVVNQAELDEVNRFSEWVRREAEARHEQLSPETLDDLRSLQARIDDRRPAAEVREAAVRIASRVAQQLGVRTAPEVAPDLVRGAEIFHTDCSPCHGASGAGDGWAAPELDPPPTSFRESRMKEVSPHQAYGAMRFGIDGTSMPSWDGARRPEELWDVAFYVMTLRADMDPVSADPGLDLSVDELASWSDDDLRARLDAHGVQATQAQIDYYRAHPAGGPGSAPTDERLRPADEDIGVALRLQAAFQRVAATVFPSVVGIETLREVTQNGTQTADPRWVATGLPAAPPGFERIAAGTGFFISDDGYILTCSRMLLDPSTGKPAQRIDVEIDNTRHEEARLVALEPTVDMAVLKVEVPFAVPPARVGDASRLRIGDWVIAIGDPPGVERTFAPGNVASPAIRDCYQEQRTATLIQTSLVIPAQSYGGPLVDIHGDVVGLTLPAREAPPIPGIPTSPVVSALPIQLALTLFEPLREAESRVSPWIGISVLNLTWRIRREMKSSPQTGIYIENVFDPSPASVVGVRPGDVLVRMDDRRIFAVQDFQKALYLFGIGKKITLELFRAGSTFTRDVTITDRPPEATTR